MINVVCHTNLDLEYEIWPTQLPALPRVGDEVESASKRCNGFRLKLKVVSVTWKYNNKKEWYPYIELHMTDCQRSLLVPSELRERWPNAQAGSIVAFYGWYAPLVGRSVSSFI